MGAIKSLAIVSTVIGVTAGCQVQNGFLPSEALFSPDLGETPENMIKIDNLQLHDSPLLFIGEKTRFTGFTGPKVGAIEVTIDDWSLGKTKVKNQAIDFSYSFVGEGKNRRVEVTAYNSEGSILNTKSYIADFIRRPSIKVHSLKFLPSAAQKGQLCVGISKSDFNDEAVIQVNGIVVERLNHWNSDFCAEIELHGKEPYNVYLGLYDNQGRLLNQTERVLSKNGRDPKKYFNSYILRAIKYLESNYKLLGYDINAVLTHDVPYGNHGTISRTKGPLSMCVAAQLEIILTAMRLYSQQNQDQDVFGYLPVRSWQRLGYQDIRGHIWVNPKFDAWGTADALIRFGMGERVEFSKLRPGAFVNINRINKTGHAVVFISYIDKTGKEHLEYNKNTVGFKYFSAQGRRAVGHGGYDYRYAVFNQYGCPKMPGKRDCGIIFSTRQMYLNTGMMLAPPHWNEEKLKNMVTTQSLPPTQLDPGYFLGLTTDD